MKLLFIMYWFYIIKNEVDIYYKGFTNKLYKRVFEHNSNLSRYTSDKGPLVLVYSKVYITKKEALTEEKRIKRLNIKSIENLISVG